MKCGRPWVKPWAARFQAKRAEFYFIVCNAKKLPQNLCNLTVDRLPKICQNVVTKERRQENGNY